jgi:hypothetical protein
LGVHLLLAAVTLALSARAQQGDVAEEAPPQTPQAAAAELKARGDDAMARMSFAEALDAYDQAYAKDPQPALLYNRARALQFLDRNPEALAAFVAFEREAPAEVKQKVPRLTELIAAVRIKVATLAFEIAPDGVSVVVGGRDLGVTPLPAMRLNAAKGVAVLLKKDGYHTVERRIDLPGKMTATLRVELQRRDATALLMLRSPTPGARVRIDGRPYGNAPAESYIQPGTHRVVVDADGYEPAVRVVVVQVGERKMIDVPLQPVAPLYKRWWLWTTVGAVVVTGVAVGSAVAASIERNPAKGTIEPGVVSTPTMLRWHL